MEQKKIPAVDTDPCRILEKIRVFVLDMDGTIYLGDQWIDGAKDFLNRIRETGRSFIFLTNNSSKDPLTYAEKLQCMGFDAQPSDIITSGQACAWYLKKNHPGKRVCLLGNQLLTKEFEEEGILLDQEDPEIAVIGFDTSLNYPKLCRFCDLVRKGLPYIATHPDLNCPTESGFIPDTGAMMELIHASAFRRPDIIIGKPYHHIADYLMDRLRKNGYDRLRPEEVAVVGDRLYTDIAAGVNAGMRSVLVLSGETGLADLSGSAVLPDLLYHSVREIPL